MDKSSKILVFDGHSMVYRAFFGLMRNPLVNTQGKNVTGVHGFFQMLFSIIDSEKPQGVVIVFDSGKKSFRNNLYPEYKAKRDKSPQDLIDNIPLCIELAQKMGFYTIIAPEGYEGDDVYGTCADILSNQCTVGVVTGDKDAFQLLGENIEVLMLKGSSDKKWYTSELFQEEMGITPSNFIDLKALMGDSSDNIPGVSKIGEKTGLEIIQKYKNLETLFENLEDFSGKRKEYLSTEKDQAFLFREIVTINKDIPLNIQTESIQIHYQENGKFQTNIPDKNVLQSQLQELELAKIAERFFSESMESPDSFSCFDDAKVNYREIRDIQIFEMLLQQAQEKGFMALDLETDSLDPLLAEISGISISLEVNKGWYIPLRHEHCDFNQNEEQVLKFLSKLLSKQGFEVIGHNLKYDLAVLAQKGVVPQCKIFDTMIGAWLIGPEDNRFSLSDCARRYLQYKMIEYSDIVNKDQKISEVDFSSVVSYACEDADIALRLYYLLKDKMDSMELLDAFYSTEIPLIPVLMEMESKGIAVDENYLVNLNHIFSERLKEIEGKLYEIAGEEFNPRSVKQLGYILFEKLEIPPVKKTKTGFSTDVSVLEELADKGYEICILLMEHRTLTKLKGNYGEKLVEMIHPKTGRIHTSYHQCGTQTGRLSSSEPNLQNIPVKTETGMQIRRAFSIKDDTLCFLSVDYSQIELRILAHFSSDPQLVKCYQNKLDVHQHTASQLFNVDFDLVTSEMRRFAKTINFGLIYGMGSFNLAGQLKIPRKQAQEYIDLYFERYEKVGACLEKFVEDARNKGFATTITGRKRKIWELFEKNKNTQKSGERIAKNTPIQGSAADLIKLAMKKIHQEFLPQNPDVSLLLQVHDELVFELPKKRINEVYKQIEQIMIHAYEFSVPLEVNGKWGGNLADMQEV